MLEKYIQNIYSETYIQKKIFSETISQKLKKNEHILNRANILQKKISRKEISIVEPNSVT